MRICGINWVAALVAAIAIYAVGAILYGFLIPPGMWMEASGIAQADMERVGMSRMVWSPVMPLMTAFGIALLFKWGGVTGLASGVKWAALVAFLSAIPTILYGWVYGVGPFTQVWIDGAHLLIGHCVAGAILASWK